jgi:hypothetical protein
MTKSGFWLEGSRGGTAWPGAHRDKGRPPDASACAPQKKSAKLFAQTGKKKKNIDQEAEDTTEALGRLQIV